MHIHTDNMHTLREPDYNVGQLRNTSSHRLSLTFSHARTCNSLLTHTTDLLHAFDHARGARLERELAQGQSGRTFTELAGRFE